MKKLIIILMGLLLCNCSSDPMGDYPVEPEGGPQYYISLNLNFYSADEAGTRSSASAGITDSRANPNGGEEGDGREDALARENAIANLYLAVYNVNNFGTEIRNPVADPLNDEAAAAAIYIRKVIKIEKLNELGTYKNNSNAADPRNGAYLIPVSGWEPQEGDRIFVYANSQTDLTTDLEGKPLREIRDLCPQTSAWLYTNAANTTATTDNNVKNATYFTMATARTTEPERTGVNGRGSVIMVDGEEMVNGKIYFTVKEDKVSDESGNVTVEGARVTGYPDDPFFVSATIERTAARIDFWFRNTYEKTLDADFENGVANKGDVVFEYDVNKEDGNPSGDKVYITHIRTFNVMQQPSRWFKHVTEGEDFNLLKYCHPENPVSGIPTNYVVEPNTLSGKSADLFGTTAYNIMPASDYPVEIGDPETLGVYVAGSTTEYIADAGFFSDEYKISALKEKGNIINTDAHGNVNTGGTWRSLILAYANENTFPHKQSPFNTDNTDNTDTDNIYATGIIFRAIYAQAKENEHLTPGTTVNTTDGKTYTYGVRYYRLWILHANTEGFAGSNTDNTEGSAGSNTDNTEGSDNTDNTEIPMRYAIVRNNIYRVGINFGHSGIISPSIYVRKWNKREHHEIVM